MGRTLVANRRLTGSACGKRRRTRPLNAIVSRHFVMDHDRKLEDLLPKQGSLTDLGERASDRWFSWPALIAVVIVVILAALGEMRGYSDLSFKLAIGVAAVVAILMVAPHLFMSEERRTDHPDPDVRALIN